MGAVGPNIESFMRLPVFPTIFFLLFSLIVLAVMPLLVSLAPSRSAVQQQLAETIGFEVQIADDIELRLLPRPQLFLRDIHVPTEKRWGGQQGARIERAIIDLSWRRLFGLGFGIGRLTLQDAVIDVDINADPEHLISSFSNAALPPIDIQRGYLTLTGLSRVNPLQQWQLNGFDAQIGRAVVGASRRFSVQHRPEQGAVTRFNMVLGGGQQRVAIDIQAQSDDGDSLEFAGFLQKGDNWQAIGEVNLGSRVNLAHLIADPLGLRVDAAGKNVELSGLIRINSRNIVSDDLQVQALAAGFRTRLSFTWPNEEQKKPHIEGRLSAGFVDLSQLHTRDDDAPPQRVEKFLTIGTDVLRGATGRMRLEANRFSFADEDGRNLLISMSRQENRLRFERVSADLPFNSSLLGAGDITYGDQKPIFKGSVSARSSDTLGLSVWLAKIIGRDVSLFVENVDEARLQRLSFVTDVNWSAQQFSLSGLAGRLGDDRIDMDMDVPSDTQKPAQVKLRMQRLDFADWGLAPARNNNLRVATLLPNLDIGRAFSLSGLNAARRAFNIALTVDRLYADVRDMGPMSFVGAARNGRLEIENMILSDYDGAQITIGGILDHDGQTHGDIKLSLATDAAQRLFAPLMSRLSPFSANFDAPLKIDAAWSLSARSDADWPNVGLVAKGRMGAVDLSLNVISPDRALDFNVAGSKVKLEMKGKANDLAARAGLPPQFDKTARGAMTVDIEAQAGDVLSLNGNLKLHDDHFGLIATVRPDSTGRRLEGALQARGKHLLALMSDIGQGPSPLAFDGKSQITVTKEAVGFTGLNMALDDGTVSGEGLYNVTDGKTLLRANLLFDGFDATPFLPRFAAEKTWSQEPMSWFLLGQSNADLELRFRSMQLGRLPLTSLEARLKVSDGVLEAPEIEIATLGGVIQANLQAEGGNLTPLFNLDVRFSELELAAFFSTFYDQALVEADLSGTLLVRGRGRSAMEMMASLSGNANVEASSGRLNFLTLPRLQNLTSSAAPPIMPDFERALGVFNLGNGKVETGAADIVFAPPHGEAKISSTLDLLSRHFDLRLDFSDRQTAPIFPVQLKGDLAAPELIIEEPVPSAEKDIGQTPVTSALN